MTIVSDWSTEFILFLIGTMKMRKKSFVVSPLAMNEKVGNTDICINSRQKSVQIIYHQTKADSDKLSSLSDLPSYKIFMFSHYGKSS